MNENILIFLYIIPIIHLLISQSVYLSCISFPRNRFLLSTSVSYLSKKYIFKKTQILNKFCFDQILSWLLKKTCVFCTENKNIKKIAKLKKLQTACISTVAKKIRLQFDWIAKLSRL